MRSYGTFVQSGRGDSELVVQCDAIVHPCERISSVQECSFSETKVEFLARESANSAVLSAAGTPLIIPFQSYKEETSDNWVLQQTFRSFFLLFNTFAPPFDLAASELSIGFPAKSPRGDTRKMLLSSDEEAKKVQTCEVRFWTLNVLHWSCSANINGYCPNSRPQR